MIKKNWKKIVVIILIILVSTSIGVYAEYALNATEVSYTKQGGGTISVKEALDDLYSKAPKFTQGQLVTYKGEQFHVLYESKDIVELFAKTNINQSATAQANAASGLTQCVFASGATNSQYWGNNAGLNLNLEPGYAITDAMGKARSYAKIKGAIDGRLLTKEDIENLTGCTAAQDNNINYSSITNTTIKNMIDGKGNENGGGEIYWLGTGDTDYTIGVKVVYGNTSDTGTISFNYGQNIGVRPVLTVYKSEIQPVI